MQRVVVSCLVLVIALLAVSASFGAVPDWLSASEISHAVSLPDGSHVRLNLESIIKIKNDPAYIVIVEPFSAKDRLICLTNPSPELRLGQVVDIEGDLTTLPSGVRALENVTVWGYASLSGELIYHPSIVKFLPVMASWPWSKIDLTVESTVARSIITTQSISSNEPNSDPAPGPLFYSRIGSNVDSGRVQIQRVHVQSFQPSINSLEGLEHDSPVDLQCKRIIAVGTEPVGGTVYKYFDMAEDAPSTDWIRCYYSAGTPTTDTRVSKITGQIQYTSAPHPEVICIDDGPDYDPQTLVGKLDLVSPNTMAYARTIQSGASVTLTGKIVTSDKTVNKTDFPDAIYVQEPSTSGCFGGIRVCCSGDTFTRGDIVSIVGTMALAADGEREITQATVTATGSGAASPLGMPNKSLGGGDFNIYTPGVNCPANSGKGLYNKGLLVKSWGKVTAVDAANKCFYIDDGTGFQDGSGNTGVKVSWAWPTAGKPTILPPSINWYVSVTGISSSDTADGGVTYYRVIRPRDYSDILALSPQDSSNPVVTFTMPSSNGQIHLASGQTSVQLAGIATDADTGIASVQISTVSGNWQPATSYNATTHVWTYDWQTPQTQTISVKATDFAGHATTTSVDVTVSVVTVIYVDNTSGNDGNTGLSWAFAKKTISGTTGAMNAAAAGGKDIWVKSGIYVERVSMKSGVALYGGFAGTENLREARNWKMNQVILDGGAVGSVVTLSNVNGCFIDGFTIQNGAGTYMGYTYYGGGIYCVNAIATIANNIIRHNNATGYLVGGNGGGLYAFESTLAVLGNVIRDNNAVSGGGIYFSNTIGHITNNTIIRNVVSNDGGGIYLASGSPDLTLTNNIVAYNSGGGIYSPTDTSMFAKNDVYGNDENNKYEYSWTTTPPGTDLTPVDPLIPNRGSDDWCIAGTSPCINAGVDTTTAPYGLQFDIDHNDRKTGGVVDIGAYESSRYVLTLSAEENELVVGASVLLTAQVFDTFENQPATAYYVELSVDAGEITSVTRNGVDIPLTPTESQTTYGVTGTDGKVNLLVTRQDQGDVHIAASIIDCGKTLSDNVRIWFYNPEYETDWTMFHHDVALRGVTPSAIGWSIQDPDPANRLPKKWVAQLNGNSTTTSEHTWASPIVADGAVYVGTNTGWLYAFDVASGTKLAEKNVGAPIHGTPCIYNGVIYVGAEHGVSGRGRLYAYSLDRQAQQFVELWRYDCPANRTIWGSISVYDDAAYFGTTATTSGFTYGYFHTVDLVTHQDRNGSPVFMPWTAVGNTPGIDIYFSAGPRAYLSDFSCNVAAITCQTGAAAWGYPGWSADTASMYASPVAYLGYVFVGSQNDCVYRLTDVGNGASYVSFHAGGDVDSTPAAYNGKIYFGCSNNNIYCVDALTLKQSSVKNLGSAVVSSPAISSTNGLVFVARQNNATIYALDANNVANQLWSYDIYADHPNALIKSSPAIADGRMFIVAGDSSNRYLYCFGD